MAKVSFKKGLLDQLSQAARVEGQLLITTDEHALYFDVAEGNRIRISDLIVVENDAALPEEGSRVASAFYYVKETNSLKISNGSEWKDINEDTGAIKIKVDGNGSSAIQVGYSDQEREITITIPKTLVDSDTLNEKIGAIEVQDVKTYVDQEIGKLTTGSTSIEKAEDGHLDVKVSGSSTNVLKNVDGGLEVQEITISKGGTESGIAAKYTFKRGETEIGSVDIPTDLVVESGKVIKVDAQNKEQYPDLKEGYTYIELVLSDEAETKIYIDVKDLIDEYTVEQDAEQVQLKVGGDTNRQLSATIVDGAVTTIKIANSNVTEDKLAASAVTTEKLGIGAVTNEKITDGTITENKLDDELKAKIDATGALEWGDFVTTPKFIQIRRG